MARNKQTDLNDILFEQLERLNDDEYMKGNASEEMARASAVANVGKTIVSNMKLALEVSKHQNEYGLDRMKTPKLLSNE